MYYETRIYQPLNFANCLEAATAIKTRTATTYHALTIPIPNSNKQLIIVDDSHCDNYFLEVAVIIKDNDSLQQIETITAGWIDTAKELAEYFNKAITNPYPMGKASLNLGTVKPEATAHFTCGCCGTGFKSNVAKQLKFDQDSGYGICTGCEQWYS